MLVSACGVLAAGYTNLTCWVAVGGSKRGLRSCWQACGLCAMPCNTHSGNPPPACEACAKPPSHAIRLPSSPPLLPAAHTQTEEEATVNLNAINRLAQQQGRAPWSLSFSFGRSLQVGGLWCRL